MNLMMILLSKLAHDADRSARRIASASTHPMATAVAEQARRQEARSSALADELSACWGIQSERHARIVSRP